MVIHMTTGVVVLETPETTILFMFNVALIKKVLTHHLLQATKIGTGKLPILHLLRSDFL